MVWLCGDSTRTQAQLDVLVAVVGVVEDAVAVGVLVARVGEELGRLGRIVLVLHVGRRLPVPVEDGIVEVDLEERRRRVRVALVGQVGHLGLVDASVERLPELGVA